jgi:hypothetical protein
MDPDPKTQESPPLDLFGRKLRGKRAELAAWIARERPAIIGEGEWERMLAGLKPSSESYLRKLVRECDVPLAPIVEGVRQEGLESLEKSLLALYREYERGDAAARKRVRRIVIEAKDHANWALRKAKSVGGEGSLGVLYRQEIIRWILTWLENPPLFEQWAQLRKATMRHEAK